jgi:magnesium chelatase subunit I
MENLISNAERRTLLNGEKIIFPRITDLNSVLPGMTGKIELVFEGEQEGSVKVSKALIGKSVREVFRKYFPDPLQKKVKRDETAVSEDIYSEVIKWFESGNYLELTDDLSFNDYFSKLKGVAGLEKIVKRYVKTVGNDYELATMMEFVLDGLHNNSKIAKDELEEGVSYKDMVGSMLFNKATKKSSRSSYDYEEDWNY